MKVSPLGNGFLVRKNGTLCLFRDVSPSVWYVEIECVMEGVIYKSNKNLCGHGLCWIKNQIKSMYTEEELLEFIINNFS